MAQQRPCKCARARSSARSGSFPKTFETEFGDLNGKAGRHRKIKIGLGNDFNRAKRNLFHPFDPNIAELYEDYNFINSIQIHRIIKVFKMQFEVFWFNHNRYLRFMRSQQI